MRVDDSHGANHIGLPPELLAELGLESDDEIWAVQTDEGLLLTTREALEDREFAEVEAELGKHGLSLDEIVESGREMRGELLKERYGIDA
jgi:hypothetical protein